MSGGVTGPGALQYEGDYNVVFTTLSFAGLVDGSNGTKAELMGNILNFFGLTPAQ
jgi:flagellar biosynthesis protein FliR